jgi:Trypsin-co-occurring domain 2
MENQPVIIPPAAAEGGRPAELSDAIEAVRQQLIIARDRSVAGDQDLKFEVGDIEMEFVVSVTRDKTVKGGVKVWVLDVGASGGQTVGATQRVRVTLRAIDPITGLSPQVSDRSAGNPPS